MGAKKFDTSLETREIKLFGRDIPGFCRDIPGAPKKFEKKKFGFNFRSLKIVVWEGVWVRKWGGGKGGKLLKFILGQCRDNLKRKVLQIFESSRQTSSGWPWFGSVPVWVWNGSGGSEFRFGRFL